MTKKFIIQPDNSDISYFTGNVLNTKSTNDLNNKEREKIINFMPYIDSELLDDTLYGTDWTKLKVGFDESMKKLCPLHYLYKIEYKAGRKFNYDFVVSFFDEAKHIIIKIKLEFKYNVTTIEKAPQFVSPMKPSQYLSKSFEEYYYDLYLVNLLKKYNLDVPDKNIYLKTIHSNKPECMKSAKLL